MSEPRRALVLHLAGNQEPLLIAVTGEVGEELAGKLADMIHKGEVETVTAENGTGFAVNFARVVVAHVDVIPGLTTPYGSKPRER